MTIGRDPSAAERPLPHPGLPSLHHRGEEALQGQGEEAPRHVAVKVRGSTQVGWRAAGHPGVLLKGPHADSWTNTRAELQGRDSRLKSPRGLRTDPPVGDMGFVCAQNK